MKRTIFFIAIVTIAGHIYSQIEYTSLSPAVLLPDKSEFKTWENLTQYTKTYVVDQKHPNASDNNTGDEDHPFLTINKASQIVRAGERVLIKSGIYREKVTPQLGGISNKQMICYEAAPGAKVVIKGSRISVEFILELLASDVSEDEIIEDYPHITKEDIHACLRFAADSFKNDIFFDLETA